MTDCTPDTLRKAARLGKNARRVEAIDECAAAWEAEQNEDIRRHEEWLNERNTLRQRLEVVELESAMMQKVLEAGIVSYNALRQRLEAADEAMRQALSDFEWAEKTSPGTNFQASILLLRAALAREGK